MDARVTDALRAQLGDPLPDCLTKLDDREGSDLANAMAEARERQAVDVDAAVDGALKRLPPGLRGAVRIVLLG
jgi:hypothetical protein